MRSATARKAAARNKRRPPSVLRPQARRTRNADPRGIAYMKWVRETQPCIVCAEWGYRQETRTEFAHIDGNAAAKAPNMHGLGICTWHHQGHPHCQENDKRNFGRYWNIDIEANIVRLNAEFERTHPLSRSEGTAGVSEEGR